MREHLIDLVFVLGLIAFGFCCGVLYMTTLSARIAPSFSVGVSLG